MEARVREDAPDVRRHDGVFDPAARVGFVRTLRDAAAVIDTVDAARTAARDPRLRRAVDELIQSVRAPLPPPERLLVAFKELLRAELPLRPLPSTSRRLVREALIAECIEAYFARRAERERARGPRRTPSTS